jgi:putative transposase
MISRGHTRLSIKQQCELLGISRSSYYFKPKGESKLNLELMRLMDEHYLEHPYKGAPMMYAWLKHEKGYNINIKRIERLYYEVMGLRAVAPGKHTTKRNPEHKAYPYLLRNLKIERPNQVWATDITYIPMEKGFMYLTAILDLYSRYVVNWSISNTMDAEWCAGVLEEAIILHGKPEIINTDQGSQYTSETFTKMVFKNEIKLSMDGKGRATDNAFVERLWRSVKYEKIYLNPPSGGIDLNRKMVEYFDYYNHQRQHSKIDNAKPSEKYYGVNKPIENVQVINIYPHISTKEKRSKKEKIRTL